MNKNNLINRGRNKTNLTEVVTQSLKFRKMWLIRYGFRMNGI